MLKVKIENKFALQFLEIICGKIKKTFPIQIMFNLVFGIGSKPHEWGKKELKKIRTSSIEALKFCYCCWLLVTQQQQQQQQHQQPKYVQNKNGTLYETYTTTMDGNFECFFVL
ncbi:hypothetical protein BLOT_014691, partial [Blomia tropicalis]